MKISVIVPVYNVEQYLTECVESILLQDIDDYELILVDDGSTDNSGKICDQLKKNNTKIRVIHKINGGLMAAWKTGVQHAKGKYIGFVDSDDWIDSNMYSTLLDAIESNDADFVTCNLIREYANGYTEYKYNYIQPGIYNKEDIVRYLYPSILKGNNYVDRGISINRVTKLFKRSLLLSVMNELLDEVTIGEDLLTTFKCMLKANRISVLDHFFPYHYRIHNQSMVKKYSDSKYEKISILHKELVNTFCNDYDFILQINTDYIKLLLMQLDDEILSSNKKYLELRRSIKQRFGSSDFKKNVKNSEYRELGIKYKIYIFLFKMHFLDIAILIRKLK